MSGNSAFLIVEPGTEFSRTVVRRLVEDKGLKFEGLDSEELEPAEVGYRYAVKGAG